MKTMKRKGTMSRPQMVAVACALGLVGPAVAAHEPGRGRRPSEAIDSGVSFLVRHQHPSGAFVVEHCGSAAMDRDCGEELTVAGAIIVLYALRHVGGPAAEALRQRTAAFLRAEQTPQGVWRYLARAEPGYTRHPPDLDDTAIAALALSQAGAALPGHAEGLLAYRNAAGLFPTWVADADPGADPEIAASLTGPLQDVDCAVNAHVLSYLASRGLEPAPVCSYLKALAEQGLPLECSIYYPRREALAYAWSRAYASGATCLADVTLALRQALLQARDPQGRWGDALHTALAITSLLQLGHDPADLAPAVAWLLQVQDERGAWSRQPYFFAPRINWWHGSAEVTTAFVLEALSAFQRASLVQ